jgi:hypothetical protein
LVFSFVSPLFEVRVFSVYCIAFKFFRVWVSNKFSSKIIFEKIILDRMKYAYCRITQYTCIHSHVCFLSICWSRRLNSFLAHQDDCLESYCHDPGVSVGISVGVTPEGFEPWGIGVWYFTYRYLMKRPFILYQLKLWPSKVILNSDLVLTEMISFEPNALGLWNLRRRCIMKRLRLLTFWPSSWNLT